MFGDSRFNLVAVCLILGCALGICPDAIRSHVRISHVLRCLEVFEDRESGQKTNPDFLRRLCSMQIAGHARLQSWHACFHHCAQCFVLFGRHCVLTEHAIFHSRCGWPELLLFRGFLLEAILDV